MCCGFFSCVYDVGEVLMDSLKSMVHRGMSDKDVNPLPVEEAILTKVYEVIFPAVSICSLCSLLNSFVWSSSRVGVWCFVWWGKIGVCV